MEEENKIEELQEKILNFEIVIDTPDKFNLDFEKEKLEELKQEETEEKNSEEQTDRD